MKPSAIKLRGGIPFAAALALVAYGASTAPAGPHADAAAAARARPAAQTHLARAPIGSPVTAMHAATPVLAAAAAHSHAPRLVQAGAGLSLLGMTSDRRAIYLDGQDIYATALTEGARRTRIASSPAGAAPFVHIRGKVAFVWTDPRNAVSPLVVWSAKGGARLASTNSPIGQFATAASDDGEQIVFPADADAGGANGNLVLARADLSRRRTLLSGITLAFGTGACSPQAGFARGVRGASESETAIAVYCEPGATDASLSVFPQGGKRILLSGLRAPPLLTSNRDGTRFWTRNAQRQGVMVTAWGEARIVDNGPVGIGFWAGPQTLIYAALGAGGIELRRAVWGESRITTMNTNVASFAVFTFGIKDSAISPDGSKLPFVSGFNPFTGISDQHLLRTSGPANDTVVEANQQTLLCGFDKPFTGNSRHFIFAQNVNPNTFTTPIAAHDEHGVRVFSDELGWSCAGARDSFAVFNDNTDLANGAADLKLVDLSSNPLAPRLIWRRAGLNFSVSSDGRVVAFTTAAQTPDQGPQGLYAYCID